jgi:hypothetical protein
MQVRRLKLIIKSFKDAYYHLLYKISSISKLCTLSYQAKNMWEREPSYQKPYHGFTKLMILLSVEEGQRDAHSKTAGNRHLLYRKTQWIDS